MQKNKCHGMEFEELSVSLAKHFFEIPKYQMTYMDVKQIKKVFGIIVFGIIASPVALGLKHIETNRYWRCFRFF